jgi:hypothetical protein
MIAILLSRLAFADDVLPTVNKEDLGKYKAAFKEAITTNQPDPAAVKTRRLRNAEQTTTAATVLKSDIQKIEKSGGTGTASNGRPSAAPDGLANVIVPSEPTAGAVVAPAGSTFTLIPGGASKTSAVSGTVPTKPPTTTTISTTTTTTIPNTTTTYPNGSPTGSPTGTTTTTTTNLAPLY